MKIKVYEVSDNYDLSGLQTHSLELILPELEAILQDVPVGEEYEISIKVAEMEQEDYENLPEYQF